MTTVLMDNSAFAGVMRLCHPQLIMHQRFLWNYPEHRGIDERSLADFLTALCIYDRVFLESSSGWNERELQKEGYNHNESRFENNIDGSTASWAKQLVRLLPSYVSDFVKTGYAGKSAIDENESCEKAYEIMCSPLKSEIMLRDGEKLPNVYYAPDYVYRKQFHEINDKNNNLLDNDALAQAMFLHRGLFLQAISHRNGFCYMPYHYRGRMLANLPPMIWAKTPDEGIANPRLPLARGKRPDENLYTQQLNEYYYSLLELVSWTTYDSNIPFIGAAILSKAHGQPLVALDIAMEFRTTGSLRARFAELHEVLEHNDRPQFESLLRTYKKELDFVAASLGADIDIKYRKTLYKLVISWLPKSIQGVIDAAIECLPESLRHWGRKTSTSFITKTPFQMLFIDHVSSIQNA